MDHSFQSRLRWLLGILISLMGCATTPASPPTPTPAVLASELTFYNWEGDMPQSILDMFTKEYGIKVNYITYESQEQAYANLKAGQEYDVAVMDNRYIPLLVQEGLLAEIDHRYVPNFKNISANFRDLVYDPGNKYTVPYNWGTTGLLVRSDLVDEPVTSWRDLWHPRYAGKVGLWDISREVIALTMKAQGYSANSETASELEAILTQLNKLKPHIARIVGDSETMAEALAQGEVVIAMGYAADVTLAQATGSPVIYILPKEGPLLWGDNFVIPASSPNKYTAELFLNFILRPEISAQIVNENYYASPNEAARPFIDPAILNDPVIFPPDYSLKNAEIILPLSPAGQKLYDDIWARFAAANPPESN